MSLSSGGGDGGAGADADRSTGRGSRSGHRSPASPHDEHEAGTLLSAAHLHSDAGSEMGSTSSSRARGVPRSWRGRLRRAARRLLPPHASGFEQLGPHDGEARQPHERWCPEEQAGLLSRLLFTFANSLVAKGARKHLEQSDLWDTAAQDMPGLLWERFAAQLRASATPAAPQGQLLRSLWAVHGRLFVETGGIKLVHDCIMFTQPFILEQLLKHLSGPGDRWVALGLSLALLAAALLEALSVNVYFNKLFRMSLHVKTQLLELLYRKSLRISSAVKTSMGVGPIVNLQSNDAAKLWTLPSYMHMLWNAPFQIIAIMAMLVRVLTIWPALAGLGVTVALIPLTMLLGKALTSVRKLAVAAADARVKLVTEVITGMKAIKLYAWEEPYQARITQLREDELRAIRRTQLLGMVNSSIFNTGPVLVSLAAFGTYAALGHSLTAAVAFPSLALFNLLRFPIVMLPSQVMSLIAASVGISRIQAFMDAEEMQGVQRLAGPGEGESQRRGASPLLRSASGGSEGGKVNGVANGSAANGRSPSAYRPSLDVSAHSARSTPGAAKAAPRVSWADAGAAAPDAPARPQQQQKQQQLEGSGLAVSIKGGSFTWAHDTPPVLRDVTLQVPRGALVMVVGPVGSGKSSLLAALLGELTPVPGGGGGSGNEGAGAGGAQPVCVAGSVAFTAQDPWIQNATLQANVLMGLPLDAARYAATVHAACLGPDLAMLPAGDQAEIGEKGINLSGGQKHRVALARAVYAGADVVLLDDPLSAVDAHVGRHLFDTCICGALAGATRLLVTHQLQYLPRADLVVVMLEGRVAHLGSYEALSSQGLDLAAYVPPAAHSGADSACSSDDGSSEGGSEPGERAAPLQSLALLQAQADAVQRQLRASQAGGAGDGEGGSHLDEDGEELAPGALARSAQQASQVQLVPLPSFTRAQLMGGSFASHKPQKGLWHEPGQVQGQGQGQGTAAAQLGSGGGGLRQAVESTLLPVAEAAAEAASAPSAATGAAATAGGTAASAALIPVDQGQQATLELGALQLALPGSEAAQAAQAQERRAAQDRAAFAEPQEQPQLPLPAQQQPQQRQQPQLNGLPGKLANGEAGGLAGGQGQASDEAQADGKEGGASGKGRRQGQLVQAEARAKGQVKRSVYLAYLGAWGPLFLLPIAVTLGALVERGLQVLQNYVLSAWSNHTSRQAGGSGAGGDFLAGHSTEWYLALYFALGLSSVGLVLGRSALLVLGSIAASRKLHLRLLAKLLRLPMAFFDSQPTGRLINRFTKDTEAVDVQMSASVNSALTCLVGALLSLVVVVAVSPWTLAALLPLSLLYYRVQRLYIATSRELKRLDALAFSPIFQHYGESLAGLATIRAFGREALFADTNRAHIEQSNRAWWPIQLMNRWLSMRLELTGSIVVFVSAVSVGVIAPRNAGLAGLALTSALNLTGTLSWLVRQTTELEVNMNSVERMVEYKGEPEEAPAVTLPRPPPDWPAQGAVQAVQLVVRYRPELPPVLKGISFAIRPREKVGICGRTGCGKSTLMLVLFRMVEPCGGALLIDGLSTAGLGLADLRSRLSLVPQDPVIFSGSVRSNLDPFDQAGSDATIWEALRRAGIDGLVRGMGAGLDSQIQEGGNNLSGGQRQLLCMARALLRSSRILVLDEATSNVDQASDRLIQDTIRSAFADCTVLTIAHRLHTIADADRIMVLDAGQLREFDSPSRLMQLQGGVFRGLMQEAARHHGHKH